MWNKWVNSTPKSARETVQGLCNNDVVRHWFRNSLIFLIVFGCLFEVGRYVPEGFDWKMYFSQGKIHPIWTPWTKILIQYLNWPLVFAITIISIGLRSLKYRQSPIPLIFSIISLPTLWVLFMGNLDGIVLLGLSLLPWGVPLVLLKPQVSAFALLANKRAFIAGSIWLIISLLIWGFWPMNFLLALDPSWKVEWTQDISLFPWGLIVALPLMWFSRKDEDLLMAAGTLATPHLFPYHFILLMPSLARMKWPWLIATWLISWTPLLANWVGSIGWHFGNLMSLFFWFGIYFGRRNLTVNIQKARISVQSQSESG